MRHATDILIVGQGICGTFLSLELERAGIPHLVIDEQRAFSASRAAAGLINPVTGRRIVTTWMIDRLLPFAVEAYGRLAEVLGTSFFAPAAVTDFFPTAQMRLAFLKRLEEDGLKRLEEDGVTRPEEGSAYLRMPTDEHVWDACFHAELGYGVIGPCYLVDMPGLLAAARQRMLEQGTLIEERFTLEQISLVGSAALARSGSAGLGSAEDAGVRYRDIEARRIIFCDGIESFSNPYFSRLPFAPNKGEALIVEIEGLADAVAAVTDGSRAAGPRVAADGSRAAGSRVAADGSRAADQGSADLKHVFKKGMSIVPWRDGLFWVGSSYEWNFEHAEPTKIFRERAEAALREWVKLPFRVVDHWASVRPATLERRPFVGFHPLHPAVGILNGMGTKGCSLAPYFAREMVRNMVDGSPIMAEADVRRFSKILSR